MISPMTQAILMLTAHFSSSEKGTNPLTVKEWGKLTNHLLENNLRPEQLINADTKALLSNFIDSKITITRINKLLERGTLMALVTEKWLRAGIWILNRSEKEYPTKRKSRLGINSPPLLF